MTPNRNIFQLIISSDPDPLAGASPTIAINAESFRTGHPDFTYHLLQQHDVESVLAAEFSGDVQQAFRDLLPYAYKADLARYCLLLRYGGIYADLSMRLLHPIDLPPGKTMVCFRDALFGGRCLWWVSNGLIRAPAGREELKVAVNLIVQNCRDGYFGATPVHPTGPALFGRALAMTDNEADIEVGEFRNFSNIMNPHSFGYLDGAGRLVAVRMKTRHLTDLGVKGTNQYADMWDQRAIYRGAPRVLDFRDPALRLSYDNRTDRGIVFDAEMGNFITFGPYMRLEAGRYRATFTLVDLQGADQVQMDVYLPDHGVICRSRPEAETGRLSLVFSLTTAHDGVEIRLSTSFGASGTIMALTIVDDEQSDGIKPAVEASL